MTNEEIKNFYQDYADKIQEKRLNSPYVLRRYLHKQGYFSILRHIKPGQKILEVGCGEGILAVLMAKKGGIVTATDISEKNLEAARVLSSKEEVEIKFSKADAEKLPFENNSFDIVIADNVLEHLPNFERGLSEIKRVSAGKLIIGLPTCLNFCALALLGGDVYWKITRRTPYAVFLGFLRLLFNLILNKDGIDEGYGGRKRLPHLLFFPWAMKRRIRKTGLKIISFEANSLCFPYFSFLLPIIKFLDRYKDKPILRNFGCGSIAVVDK